MHLNIQEKILSGFLVLILMASIMIAGAYFSLHVIQGVVDNLIPIAEKRDRIAELSQILRDMENHLDQYLTVSGEEYRHRVAADNDLLVDKFNELKPMLDDSLRGPISKESLEAEEKALTREVILLLSLDLSRESAGRLNNQILNTYERLRAHANSLDQLDARARDEVSKRVYDVGLIIDSTRTQVLFFMLFLVLLSGAISVVVARTVTRPTLDLIRAAKRLSSGEHGARAPIRSRDEIGQLAMVFNEMADTLAAQTENLEKEVSERTKELSEKLLILNHANTELDKRATELTKRDKDLTVANEKLRELDRIKSEFLSVAAHQLRTPLSAVKWIFSVLLEEHMGMLSPKQKSYVLKGEESNNRMIRLVDDMLTVTRIESGKTEYHLYTLSLHDIVQNVVADFQPRAKEHNLTLIYENTADGVTDVIVDPEKIRFLFENLLENAMRYTPRGGHIGVSLAKEGEMFIVAFKDNGIGIPEKEQKNIFTKFFRAANAVKTITDGSGLGLFVAKNIVERHEGSLTFESNPGEGTTFSVALHPASTGIPSTGAPPPQV